MLGLNLAGERGQLSLSLPRESPPQLCAEASQEWDLLGALLPSQTRPCEAGGGRAGSGQLLLHWYQEQLMLS